MKRVLTIQVALLFSAIGSSGTYAEPEPVDNEAAEKEAPVKEKALDAAEIAEALAIRVGEWRVVNKQTNKLMEEFVGRWKEQGKSIVVKGKPADGLAEYTQVVTYDPKTGIFVESFRYQDGKKVKKHGFWDPKTKTLRIEIISVDPPLPPGVKVELLLKLTGPNTTSGKGIARAGERIVFEVEMVGRRIEKEEKVAPPKKAASRLSKEEALKITDALAKKKGFDLKFYPGRDAQYFPSESRLNTKGRAYWSVFYKRKPSRSEADFFAISVDEATGRTDYWGGLAPEQ